MNKFLRKICGFTSLLLLLNFSYARFFKINFSTKEYPHWKAASLIASHPSKNSVDVLIVGDSRVFYGIDPNLFEPLKVERISMEAARPFEILCLLKQYLDRKAVPPRLLLISFAPANLATHDDFWKFTTKFDIVSLSEMISFISRANMLEDLESIERSSYWRANWDVLIRFVGGIKYYLADYQNSNLLGYRTRNLMAIDSLRNERFLERPNIFSPMDYEIPTYDSLRMSKTLEFYLREIIELAESQNIQVLFKAIPTSEQLAKSRAPRFEDSYLQLIRSLKNDYPKTYISDELPFYQDSNLFMDPGHLNNRGAKLYSERLADELLSHLQAQELQ